MINAYASACAELAGLAPHLNETQIETACQMIADANRIVLYGCGREGLQVQGFAMRLYHLGQDATMQGAMNTPPLAKGDLFVASAGPGELSTVTALMRTAQADGARCLMITATPQADTPQQADHMIHIPAQTMATDQSAPSSTLPMGSLYEGALFVLFETMVARLAAILGETPDTMRVRHTNME